jgi:hypothetical protein
MGLGVAFYLMAGSNDTAHSNGSYILKHSDQSYRNIGQAVGTPVSLK